MKKLPIVLQAFVGLMLFSAVLHLTTLAIYFYKSHDAIPLNFFSIVGFDLFFPSLVTSHYANLYSFASICLLYVGILYFFYHENRRT